MTGAPADDELDLVICVETQVTDDGSTSSQRAIYRFAALDAKLAARPHVAADLGFDEVASCEQARAASEALLADADASAVRVEPPTELVGKSSVGAGGPASLMGGTPLASRGGVVALEHVGGAHFCTGFLASNRVVVTAAHCLAQFVRTGTQGRAFMLVKYFDPTGGTRYVSSAEGESLTVHIHPEWTSNDDAQDDIGLLIRDTQWEDTGSRDYLRFYTERFLPTGALDVYGAGTIDEEGNGNGVLRTAEFALDSNEGEYYLTLATSRQRVCRGDSGGPAIKEFDGRYPSLVAGVNTVISVTNQSDRCARAGGGQRHTRLVGEKIDWFESVTGITCHRDRLQNLYSFARCFENDPIWPR